MSEIEQNPEISESEKDEDIASSKKKDEESNSKGKMKTAADTEPREYSIKKLQQKIKAVSEAGQENKYSGWTVEPSAAESKPKKITELNLASNDAALEEIEEEIGKKKPDLGAELIEGLEEGQDLDAATKDLVQRAISVAHTVLSFIL